MLQSESLKQFVKTNSQRLLLWRYHQIQNNLVRKKIKAIRTETGPLSSTDKKLCNAYAKDILGWQDYAPWLYLYTLRSGLFKEGWIPENYYGPNVIPKIQGNYGRTSNLRSLTHKLFKGNVHPDLAYFSNDNWYSMDHTPLPEAEIQVMLKAATDKIVYKLDGSYQGQGIFVCPTENLSLGALAQKGNGLVQRFIEQHDFFDQFSSVSTACIRLTTVIKPNGQTELRGAFLRLGQANDTHVQYHSEIAVAIDLASGALHATGYHPNWTSCTHHPDHHIAFKGLVIPNFKEAVAETLSLHQQMPMVGVIGWDLIIDKEGKTVLMEWNGYGSDVAFSEVTQGPCFTGLGWEHFHKEK
ncbi:sugar-transfer associated ATP-grasp domain-containing protein [Zobellia galactanivorans]|uniref:sugar-transfer associated ATP-grasp domain-containing protein n=1 Tax=Zobellia galactanivorans (strain DSM 12802 / CCUG 47099 / CIP 106680 / NCIMB 13871 / Dsij) TaxID=63186 RepID=UPI0026E39B6D|nr:sugar-transfer associated ATP-grasp domain-containing protein [Zobellia galactanivorans]MDO6810417.1 sugar-transfer associated ATP-grasp domain-containing protein [Zobellia galactanivorans]